MTRTLQTIALVGALFAGGVTASLAQTLGDSVAQGRLSETALAQLVAGTGISTDEAKSMTLEEIVAVRWQDD